MLARKTTDTLTLTPEGDIELWYVEGMDKGWALPIHVRWLHDQEHDRRYARLDPAVSLYHRQQLVLQAVFAAHDITGNNQWWIVPRATAEAMLVKAPGISPGCYYRWPDPNCPPLIPQMRMIRVTRGVPDDSPKGLNESFVRYVAKARDLPSSVVKMVLNAVGDLAPAWMLRETQPLELGFCRLIALPYRANWKEIVAFKCRKWGLRGLFRQPTEKLWPTLEHLGMPGILCSPHNIGMRKVDRSHQIDYVIEAIPSVSFKKEAETLSKEQLTCGPSNYVAYFEQKIEKLYKHIVSALASYVSKSSMPFGRLLTGGSNGNVGLVPVGGRQVKVHRLDMHNLPVHIIPPDSSFNVTAEQSDPALVHAQNAPVPKMPALLQTTHDLRQPDEQRLLDESNDGSEGDTGLPLLDAGQGDVPGQPVLPIDTPNQTSGVD